MSDSDIDDFSNSIAELKIKKAILSVLKDVYEPMMNEDEEGQEQTDPTSNTFTVKEKWATYIKPYIGQPLSPKELDALGNFKEKKPTTIARTEIWYNTTDSFGISHTTIIRKMKDSGQFSYTSFQKQERSIPDDKEKEQEKQINTNSIGEPENGIGDSSNLGGGPPESPQGELPPGSTTPPSSSKPSEPEQQEEKDDITVTKSILFKDDIKGAAILVDFLKKLDL